MDGSTGEYDANTTSRIHETGLETPERITSASSTGEIRSMLSKFVAPAITLGHMSVFG